ncbi:MAG TPA: hypothetical protein VFX59_11100, partial [Polyangiales bacterium]|nr:hypothetical protein [Polyangiales bacterium]
MSEHWLRVLEGCPVSSDGFYDLGSFSIQRGEAALSQIRLTAFRDVDGKAVPLFEQRSEAVFHRGVSAVPFRFTHACNKPLNCAPGLTCDPSTGECGSIPRVERPAEAREMGRGPWCLERLDVPPPLAPFTVPDAGAIVQCVTGDGLCPTGCDGSRDADCRLPLGSSCVEG